MTELTIKSDQADAVKSELTSALDGQRRIIQDSIKRISLKLTALEVKYALSTSEILKREANGSLDDANLELVEWIGETKSLKRLQSELELLAEIRIYS